MRCTAAAFILLTCATPVRATLITGYAAGQLVSRSGPADPAPFPRFILGDQVEVSFTCDPDTAVPVGNAFFLPGATYRLAAFASWFRSGVSSGPAGGDLLATDGPADSVELGIGGERGRVTLLFSDLDGSTLTGTGLPTLVQLRAFPFLTLTYASEIVFAGQGFVAEMRMVDELSALPEPSTWTMGVLGAVMAAGWMRLRGPK